MKKRGFLSAPVAELIALMGHTDRLVVCDAGFPVPPNVPRIDLAITRNLPSLLDVLRVLLDDLAVEHFIVAEELREVGPQRLIRHACREKEMDHDDDARSRIAG